MTTTTTTAFDMAAIAALEASGHDFGREGDTWQPIGGIEYANQDGKRVQLLPSSEIESYIIEMYELNGNGRPSDEDVLKAVDEDYEVVFVNNDFYYVIPQS
jgi:hypothetical protein